MPFVFVQGPIMGEILHDIADERGAQLLKWGVQRHPGGTGGSVARDLAVMLKRICQAAPESLEGDTWAKILAEEVSEAFDETEWSALRKELVQSAAVIVAWIESGDAQYER
jgi:hypothetical protein